LRFTCSHVSADTAPIFPVQQASLFLPRIFLGTISGQFLRSAASRLLLSRSSRQIFLKRTEVLLCSGLRFQLFPPGEVHLTLLFLPLRNCRVPACKPIRLRSPLASLAPRKSVALKRATRSDLDAPISSLRSPVSRPCSL